MDMDAASLAASLKGKIFDMDAASLVASLKGKIFEIHSAPKPSWNGKLVEVDRIDATSGKFVTITLESPVMQVKIAPQMLKIPDVILRAKNDTSPAPSLDEEPPERGTILKLHSIGEEYDGKLVEFYKADQENGKIYVQEYSATAEPEEEWMRVKSECCVRPAMRSHSLRAFLTQLVDLCGQQMLTIKDYIACGVLPRTFKQPSLATFALIERRINTVLEIDPVCALAHLLLADLAAHRSDFAKSEDEKLSLKKLGCEHRRRSVAILGSYRAQIDSEKVRQTFRKFPHWLDEAGHHKEARRRQAALVASRRFNSEVEHAEDQMALVGFLARAMHQSFEKDWYNKVIRYCLEAIDPLCGVIRCAGQNKEVARKFEKDSIDISQCIMDSCTWVHYKLVKRRKLELLTDNVLPTPTMTALWKTALKIVDKLLGAYLCRQQVKPDFFRRTDAILEKLREFKARALREIERGEQATDTEENAQEESQEGLE